MHVSPACPKSFPKAVWSFPGNSQDTLPAFPPVWTSVTQLNSHCALLLQALRPGRMKPAWPHQPGQHSPAPPALLPGAPKPPPDPAHRGMSRLPWLCFARGWKETAARHTGSLYPLIFSQQSVSDSHPNLEGQEYYSEKSFMAIA